MTGSASEPNRSSTYLRACSTYSICSWTAVSVRPVRRVTQLAQRRVVGHGVQRRDRPVDGEVRGEELVLDHREDQRGRAELEIGRDLGEVGVADDDVQPPVLLRDCVRLVAGVDDRALQRRLEPDLDLEVVGPLGDLEAVAATVLADADPAAAGDHLAADEEGGEVPDDVGERRLAPHQVVLVGAVRGALVVGVVLVEVDRRRVRDHRRPPARLGHDPLARAVPDEGVARVRALRPRVLRVRVVDVEAGAVGEDHVGQADVLVGELGLVGDLTRQVEPTRVAQRVLLLEVPAGPPVAGGGRLRVGVDDLGGDQHRVGTGVAGHADPVLRLGPHHPPHAHTGQPTRQTPSRVARVGGAGRAGTADLRHSMAG